jgi:ABC-type Fe3+-hydroxamate transport system substrate-binding protein
MMCPSVDVAVGVGFAGDPWLLWSGIPMPTLDDDLGHRLDFTRSPTRVVSLVPSLTEALAVSAPGLLIGATDWCTHPVGLEVTRVRGTKNPDCNAVIDLQPDLVVTNKEENRRIDVDRLRKAGLPVWVTVVESIDDALRSLRRLMVEALGLPPPGWLTAAATSWGDPPPPSWARVVVPIWRDPWMTVGRRTFAGDVIARMGLENAVPDGDSRYPKRSLSELVESSPDVVILPDEPYPFSPEDGPEAFVGVATALVSGRSMTWYGPSMATARQELTERIQASLVP